MDLISLSPVCFPTLVFPPSQLSPQAQKAAREKINGCSLLETNTKARNGTGCDQDVFTLLCFSESLVLIPTNTSDVFCFSKQPKTKKLMLALLPSR